MTKASPARRAKRAAKKNGAAGGKVESIPLHPSEKKQLQMQQKKVRDTETAVAHWAAQKVAVQTRLDAATQAYIKEKQAMQAQADTLAEAHGIDTQSATGWRIDLEALELRKAPPAGQQQQMLAPPPAVAPAPPAEAAGDSADA